MCDEIQLLSYYASIGTSDDMDAAKFVRQLKYYANEWIARFIQKYASIYVSNGNTSETTRHSYCAYFTAKASTRGGFQQSDSFCAALTTYYGSTPSVTPTGLPAYRGDYVIGFRQIMKMLL